MQSFSFRCNTSIIGRSSSCFLPVVLIAMTEVEVCASNDEITETILDLTVFKSCSWSLENG